MKKIVLVSVFICLVTTALSQSNINNYKYVIIPTQIEFLKGKDPYKLSTLTRFLFKQEGFTAFYPDEQLPKDLFDDRCLAMYADIEDVEGGFRKTRLKIVLKDCYGNLVMATEVGESGENVHQKRHHEALREAFKSMENLSYAYVPKKKKEKSASEMIVQKKDEDIEAVQKEKGTKKVEKEATNRGVENAKPVEAQKEIVDDKSIIINNLKALVAKNIAQGFQILDSESKIVMTLLKTSVEDVFIVKGKDAIVFKSGVKWMYSQNDGTSEVLKELHIKF